MKKFIGFDFLNSILVFIGVFGRNILFLTRINAQLKNSLDTKIPGGKVDRFAGSNADY